MASIEKKEKSEVVLTIEISKEDFSNALMESYKKNRNRFQIPGFRKGKVPYHLVKQYYGEGVFYDDAIDFCANPAYKNAIEEHKLDVVSRPEMDIVEIGSEKGLIFTATVTEKPPVTLGVYKGVEAPYHYHPAAEEDVTAELSRIQDRNSRMIPVEDRPIQDGDTVTIDYEGFVDGVAFEGGKGENHDLKIGSKSFIPGFEEQLIGHGAGEEFAISVSFPEEYHSEELKGKEASFQVAVHGIKAKELPVLDDEFAKDVSEFDTLEEYKEDILKKKEEENKNHAENSFQDSVLGVVCENAEVEIPECMIDSEVEHMYDDQAMRMRYQGLEMDQYLQYLGQTADDMKSNLRSTALPRVKSNLVVEAIMKAEGIEATDEDVEKEIESMASSYSMSVEDLKQNFGGNDGFIRENLAMRKTVNMLAESAVKTDFHDHDHEHENGDKEEKPQKKTVKRTPAKKESADGSPEKKTTKTVKKKKESGESTASEGADTAEEK